MVSGRPLSLVITDSGLGGLSICAGLFRRFAAAPPERDLAVTYFNALPEAGKGYNKIPTLAGRARVFDRALEGMEAFRPDLILIACNTLSALYGRTAFKRAGRVPVADIIDCGLDLVIQHWRQRPESRILLLGTRTTIEAQVHADGLRARGVPAERILVQACDGLATCIEQGPDLPAVQELVELFLDQAAARCPNRRAPLIVALCCTHYGYSLPAFRRALEARFTGPVEILDPNRAMVEHLPLDLGRGEGPGPRLDLQVVSRVVWSGQVVEAIAAALEPVSPTVAQALRHYRHDPDLFNF